MSRILLIEDNEMNRDMLSRRLMRKGFEVVIAHDGPQGLDAARSGSFDLILMDLSLPGIDGWEATRLLKADPTTRPIPIIALTAHAMAGDRERAFEAGCDDYDTKPIDFARLLAKIEAIVGPQSPPMQTDGAGPSANSGHDSSSQLRHDLITPLNRILGYCDLLIEDADIQGKVYRAQGLRSIRTLGREVLNTIDRVLIRDRASKHPADLDALAAGVVPPSNAILRACEALEEASDQVPDKAQFLEDLAKIRHDSALLIEMIRGTTADLARTPPRADQGGPVPSESTNGRLTEVPSRLDR